MGERRKLSSALALISRIALLFLSNCAIVQLKHLGALCNAPSMSLLAASFLYLLLLLTLDCGSIAAQQNLTVIVLAGLVYLRCSQLLMAFTCRTKMHG